MRKIVAAGVVAIALILAALLVMMLPVARGWRDAVVERQNRAEMAAVQVSKGDAAFAAGRFEDAAMDYVLASNLDPADVTLNARLARAKTAGIVANPAVIDGANMVEVRNEVELVAVEFPQDTTNVAVVRALMKFREGFVNDAVAILDEAGKADQTNPGVHLANAVVWQAVPEKATNVGAEFDAVLAARPDDVRVQGMAGEYFVNIGQVEKGVGLLRSAAGRMRNLSWFKMVSAYALRSGDAEGAGKFLQEALVMAPRDAEVLSMFGQLQINAGQFETAVQVLQEANSIRESRDTLLQLGVALNGMKAYDRALAVLTKVVKGGRDVISMFEYANALAGVGNVAEATKVYEALLAAPDGAGTENENKVLVAIKEDIRRRMAALPPTAPAKK